MCKTAARLVSGLISLLTAAIFQVAAYSAPPTAVRLKGVQLEVSVSKDRFNKSEPINLNLVVSNDSKREIYIVESNVLRDYEIEVRDQRGLVVPISTEGKQLLERAQWVGRRVLFAIEPGTSRTHIFELSKIFEMGEPGIYTIKAKRKVFVKKGSQPIELSGKAVTVTLSA